MGKFLLLISLCIALQSRAQKNDESSKSKFDEVFKRHGGRLHNAQPPFKGLVDFVLEVGRNSIADIKKSNSSFPDVYIDIINDSTVNARSTSDKRGRYFIGINLGTVIILQDAFFRMLASKNVFTDIGDTAKEANPKKIKNLQADNLDEFFKNRIENDLLVSPKDLKRALLGKTLMAMLIEFIVNHEYGHIVHGHIRYSHSKKPGYIINEVRDENFGDSILFYQDMEIDADIFATSHCLQYAYWLIRNHKAPNPEVIEFYKDLETFLRFWTFSTCTFYKIIGNRKKLESTSFVKSHPPPSLRARFALTTAAVILQDKPHNKSLDISKTCIDAWDEVERAFSYVSYLALDFSEMRYSIDRITELRAEAIIKNFRNYIPKMQEFSYEDLSPLYRNEK